MIINILIFLLIFLAVLFIRLLMKKKMNRESSYDERQIAVRGKAYKIGFMTTVFLNCLFLLFAASAEASQYIIAFLSISVFSGILTFAAYSILHDAFLSFDGKNRTSYMLISGLIVLIQLAGVFFDRDRQNPAELLKSTEIINLSCAVTFAAVLFLLAVKPLLNRSEED